ncbi:hypothetical protein NIES4072_11710 [Nostoc commune NIES-4072]|uniref:Uncharacterized protein n=1 Tax=Nostoc commune NIES-4072 TaxID=2005467 RepID=A0A2R5FNZ0_NOSCO|nr:hypothetical protein [Nostoc commune]BBD65164.1 hypothetical protein NIES4070_15110 [Nostoc commune HK-02]GBG17511.1 hypothetical protein NIES4072_11710 [Nostoc commune NIES-4072]
MTVTTFKTTAIAAYKIIYTTQTGARVIIKTIKIKMANEIILHSPKTILKRLSRRLFFM